MKTVERLLEQTSVLPADAIVGSGIPSFDLGRELGIFVVHGGEICQLQWTGDARVTDKRNVVEMEVTTDGPLSLYGTDSWDYTDHVLEVTDSRFRAKALVDVGTDGVDLSLHDAAVARFDFGVSGAVPMDVDETMSEEELIRYTRTKATSRRPGLVHLGTDRITPDSLPVTVWLDRDLLERKLGVAESITENSLSIDEVSRTEDALVDLLGAVEDGSVEPGSAVSAIERLTLAGNVTQASLLAVGPAGDEGDLDADAYDGPALDTPEGIEQLNVAEDAIGGVVAVLTTLLFTGPVLEKVGAVTDAPYLGSAVRQLDDAIRNLSRTLPSTVWRNVREIAEDAADELEELLIEEAWEEMPFPEEWTDELDDVAAWLVDELEEVTGSLWDEVEEALEWLSLDWNEAPHGVGQVAADKSAIAVIDEAIAEAKEDVEEALVGYFESQFDADLESTYDALADGGPVVGGGPDAAASAAQRGVERIHSLVEDVSKWSESVGLMATVADWLGIATVVLALLASATFFSGLVSVITGFLAIVFGLTTSFINTMSVDAVTNLHGQVLAEVQNA